MSGPPGVSIIVVNYNNERFLAAAIDSALGQKAALKMEGSVSIKTLARFGFAFQPSPAATRKDERRFLPFPPSRYRQFSFRPGAGNVF